MAAKTVAAAPAAPVAATTPRVVVDGAYFQRRVKKWTKATAAERRTHLDKQSARGVKAHTRMVEAQWVQFDSACEIGATLEAVNLTEGREAMLEAAEDIGYSPKSGMAYNLVRMAQHKEVIEQQFERKVDRISIRKALDHIRHRNQIGQNEGVSVGPVRKMESSRRTAQTLAKRLIAELALLRKDGDAAGADAIIEDIKGC